MDGKKAALIIVGIIVVVAILIVIAMKIFFATYEPPKPSGVEQSSVQMSTDLESIIL